MPVPLPPDDVAAFAELIRQGHEATRRPADPARGARGGKLLDVYRAGDVAILHDADGEWFTEAISAGDFDWITGSMMEAFHRGFEDEYQYLTVLLVRDFGLFGAFYQPLANDVKGIGYDLMTPGETFDTTDTQLEGFMFLNYVGYWHAYPEAGRYVFGQEFMHRWGSFVNVAADGLDENALLGRDDAHWSYWMDTPNSPMEGNDWTDLGDGTWATDAGAVSTYSELDLYLMGLVGPDDVGPLTVLDVAAEEQARVGRDPTYTPEYLSSVLEGPSEAVTVTGTPVTVTVDDIVAAEGERVPSVDDSPKRFRMAFAVLVLADDTLDEDVIASADEIRARWEADWEEDVRGLADLDTTLGAGDAATWGEPATDTGVTDTGEPAAAATPEEPAGGCGCAAPGSGAVAPAAIGLLAALSVRRRRR